MHFIVSYLLLCLGLVSSGCATIMSGNQQKVPITSTPSGAVVSSENGQRITTPGFLILSTKKVHTLVATYPGCDKQQKALFKKLNNWVFADVFWDFGIITIPIDVISGAANELKPKEVYFDFRPALAAKGTAAVHN